MLLNTIKPAEGATHYARRVGRGIGSGLGKTCGRGIKVKKAVTVVSIKWVLKAVKCLCNAVCLNVVLNQ